MYKLPVFLLIDTSGSIQGPSIFAQSNSIDVLVEDLSAEYDIEPWLAVFTYNTYSKVHQGLLPLDELTLPPVAAGQGSSDLGHALCFVKNYTNIAVQTTRQSDKAWLKPQLFIFSDGLLGNAFDNEHWSALDSIYSKVIFCAESIPTFRFHEHVVPLSFSQIRGGCFTPYFRS